MSADTLNKVTNYFREEILDGDVPPDLGADTMLIEEGLLDSLGIFELVGWIEDAFGLDVPPEAVVVANFQSLNAVTSLVERSRG